MTDAGPAIEPDTRRRLLVTGVILVVVAALLGPAFVLFRGGRSSAAFGDNHALGANHLGAATLDIEVGEQSTRLSASPMAPGDTVFGWLDLANQGDLTLHYAIAADTADDLLTDWLTWDVWTRRSCTTLPQSGVRLLDSTILARGPSQPLLGNALVGFDSGDRVLEPGEVERICIAVTLPQDAPDTLQGRTVTQDLRVLAEHHLPGAG